MCVMCVCKTKGSVCVSVLTSHLSSARLATLNKMRNFLLVSFIQLKALFDAFFIIRIRNINETHYRINAK